MKPLRLWIIEDNPSDVYLVELGLKRTTLPIVTTKIKDGDHANSLIDKCPEDPECPPDIIFLDWNIPKVSGVELLKAIRSSPVMLQTRVAVFSSSVGNADLEHMEALRVDRYLQKPASLEEFLTEVASTIEDFHSRPPASSPD